jgi:tRNA (Thr-GGU) A37 N-methylase
MLGCHADLHHVQTLKGFKGKIKPPRLHGLKLGALATRTPHRPNPIGLSLCEIIKVQDSCILLGGADIVDGSPVLDIKPYVPFCEALRSGVAPSWVSVRYLTAISCPSMCFAHEMGPIRAENLCKFA